MYHRTRDPYKCTIQSKSIVHYRKDLYVVTFPVTRVYSGSIQSKPPHKTLYTVYYMLVNAAQTQPSGDVYYTQPVMCQLCPCMYVNID